VQVFRLCKNCAVWFIHACILPIYNQTSIRTALLVFRWTSRVPPTTFTLLWTNSSSNRKVRPGDDHSRWLYQHLCINLGVRFTRT
jgi:hypothetical protein